MTLNYAYSTAVHLHPSPYGNIISYEGELSITPHADDSAPHVSFVFKSPLFDTEAQAQRWIEQLRGALSYGSIEVQHFYSL